MTTEEAIEIIYDTYAEADIWRSLDAKGHRYGELADAYKMALDALRAQQEREDPKPLTLEELREMDDPVWCSCRTIEGGNGFWCLCQKGHITTPAKSSFHVDQIPHWVFLRNKPKEGQK